MPTPIKTLATVHHIINHGEGIYTLQFKVPPRATRFKAGQFLHLTLDPFDPVEGYWPESRVFSIASKPGGDILEIVYSVKGRYTKRMSESLHEGSEIWLKLPYGDFIVDRFIKPECTSVLVAGGTGISPFIPFLLNRMEREDNSPMILYYGIRDWDHYLYREVVERLPSDTQVSVVSGLFNVEAICTEIAAQKHAVCFVSGPPVMIKHFQTTLKTKGFPAESIIIDAWE